MRRIGVEERRARLGLRHRLAPAARAEHPVEVARDLVGLHGTDPASVYLAAWARLRAPEIEAIDRALYHERVLLRILGMRRTMFVVPLELAPVVQVSCIRAIALQERRRTVQFLEENGIDDAARWLKELEEAAFQALLARGEAAAADLYEDDPRLRTPIVLARGKSYQGQQSMATRVLPLLAADGRIVRARPRGSWISGQYRWAPIDAWLPGGMPEWPVQDARVELVRRWLRSFGPALLTDLKWWTGWTVAEVKRALAEVGAVEVELDGATGVVLPDDLDPAPAAEPWAALLPALDPTVMGWAGREWYLGEHGPALFDRNGNAGPTVWWDGRVVGGWAQRRDGEVAVRLLEDVGADGVGAVEAAAERLRGWLGKVCVTPRFRTPLERELSA
jgi:Winged helix DNA-binding domain